MIDFSKISIDEYTKYHYLKKTSKGTMMITVGTKEGKLLIYRLRDNCDADPIFRSKHGISFG